MSSPDLFTTAPEPHPKPLRGPKGILQSSGPRDHAGCHIMSVESAGRPKRVDCAAIYPAPPPPNRVICTCTSLDGPFNPDELRPRLSSERYCSLHCPSLRSHGADSVGSPPVLHRFRVAPAVTRRPRARIISPLRLLIDVGSPPFLSFSVEFHFLFLSPS